MGDSTHVIHISNFEELIKNMDELLDKACQTSQKVKKVSNNKFQPSVKTIFDDKYYLEV